MTEKAERAKQALSQINAHNRMIALLEEVLERDRIRGFEDESITETCNKIIMERTNRRDNLIEQIHAIDNPDHEMLLELRYMDCFTWEEIANEMGYSITHVHRLHKKALEEFADIMDK